MADLVRGWEGACAEAGGAWGGGETQAIGGIVVRGTAPWPAAVGVVRPKERLLRGERIVPGDAILIAPATGSTPTA